MNGFRKYWILVMLLAIQPWSASAQMEKITRAEISGARRKLPSLAAAAENPFLANHLRKLSAGKFPDRAPVNAARVAEDLMKNHPGFTGQIPYYAVPAMSELQRLPDAYPLDGALLAPVRIFAARGEYEPGSFVVYPLTSPGKVEFLPGEFKSAEGKSFPAEKLDLKVVKVWYQNGNGWYSYFGDDGLKLTPELLLNDEDLIHVDTAQKRNLARLTEKDGTVSYIWISPPHEIDKRPGWPPWGAFTPFQPMRTNFRDSDQLRPVTLTEGVFKQFFLTAHVAKDQAPGLYRGCVRMVRAGAELGRIPVLLKVLNFELPDPEPFTPDGKPFLVSSYAHLTFADILKENGGDLALAKKQLEAIFANLAAHNQTLVIRGNTPRHETAFTFGAMKRAGMCTDYLMGGYPDSGPLDEKWRWRFYAKRLRKECLDSFGHTNLFLGYGDEPPAEWVMNVREFLKAYQKEGLKFFIAGGDQVFYTAGYFYDFFNMARAPEYRDSVRRWNIIGHAWTAWYAVQHVGAENPAFNRRQNGLSPYLAGYTALCNYAHCNVPYNDRRLTYKPMVFAYGSGSGVIDTLQWEGFREGVDDIRYAALLKRLARKAAASPDLDTRCAGGIALQYLAELDSASCDLNEVRLEMIRQILKLRKQLENPAEQKENLP